jgi:hypothetical protein
LSVETLLLMNWFGRVAFCLLFLIWLGQPVFAQSLPPDDSNSIRVNVTVNPDGSRTTYRFDANNHRASAVTTSSDGRILGKATYRLDDGNRFGSSVSFTADGKFRLKSIYKYDAGGRIAEETQLARDDSVLNKIVYSYDSAGRESGYSVYDGTGKLVGQTSSAARPPPATSASEGRKK